MSRKQIIILIVLLVLILAGVGGYFYFKNPTPPINSGTPNVSPFGQGGENVQVTQNPDGTTGTTGVNAAGVPVAKFFRVTDSPVAGAVAFIKNGTTIIRYADRATGHIFDVDPATRAKTQITNNTLPKIYEAKFKNDGGGAVFRSLLNDSDVINNLALTLTPPKSTSTDSLYTVTSFPLRGQIDELIAKDSGLIYTLKDTGAVVSTNFDGSKPVTLFSSAFTEWRILPQNTAVVLMTKPSASVTGFAYSLNTKTGALSKLLGPLNALILNTNSLGTRLAYSYNAGTPLFSVRDLQSKTTSNLTPVTLADKCVWGTKNKIMLFCGVPINGLGNAEPDAWYQGRTRFVDRIWKYNTDTGFTDILVEPKKDFNADIDVMNPMLSPDEDYFLFTNKNDLTLWALRLD